MAHKLGWNRETTLNLYPQINEIPFEPEHQFAATYHSIQEQVHVLVKGAPERVLSMCNQLHDVSWLRTIAQRMAEQGYRVLAIAEGIASPDLDPTTVPSGPANLTLLRFVGMIDPLRTGVKDAIAACHAAGIAVWMVTGDHPATALAISRDLGLATNASQVVTGQELEGRSPQDIQQVIYLLVSTGAAEIVLIGLAVGTGLPLPLLPVQLLWLNIGTLMAFLIHVIMMHLPIGNLLLSTEPVDLKTWGILIALSLTVLMAMEMHKFWRSHALGNGWRNRS